MEFWWVGNWELKSDEWSDEWSDGLYVRLDRIGRRMGTVHTVGERKE